MTSALATPPRDLIVSLHVAAGYIAHRANDTFPGLEDAFYEQVGSGSTRTRPMRWEPS